MILLESIWACTGWLAHYDRFSFATEIGHIRHAGRKSPPACDYEQASCPVQFRHEYDFGDQVLASVHVIAAAIPSHINDQAFCRVLRDELHEHFVLFFEALVGTKIHVDGLRRGQIGKLKRRLGILEGKRRLPPKGNE